jgi:sodium/proline symporter
VTIVETHTIFMMLGYLFFIGLFCFISNHVTHTISDFVLGGRSLSGPVAAMGACASDMSSWLVMALPAVAWMWGWQALWVPLGLVIGSYCNWTFVAARLRIYTELLDDALTIPDYLVRRFEDGKGILRMISALVVLIFFVGYSASGLVAASLLVHTVFALTYLHALILITIIFTLYTVLGGFLAISWVDFFQGTLVFISVLLLLAALHAYFPAWHAWPEFLNRQQPAKLGAPHVFSLEQTSQGVIAWLSKIAWGLGYFGQVHILVRFMAIKHVKQLSSAKWIAIFWMTVAMLVIVVLGLLGYAIFMPDHANFNPQLVILMLVKHFFSTYWYGFAVALVMSVIMSALAAQLLVSSSALSEDIYRVYIRPHAGKVELLMISRISVVVIAAIAACFAYNPQSSIYEMVAYAWSGLGAAFGPVILMSLMMKSMTHRAAVLGMLSGAATVILWLTASHFFGGIFQLYELIPGFMVSSLVIFVVSRFNPTISQKMRDSFDQYQDLYRKSQSTQSIF